MNFAKTPQIYRRPAQLEKPPKQSPKNWTAKTCVLHCGGRCKSTLPKLVQRCGNKSPGMCNGETFQIQQQGPRSHYWIEQNLPEQLCHPIWRPVIYPNKRNYNRWQLLFHMANTAGHYILQPIAGVLREAELFRRFFEDIIWIARSELSNESIRQALTSAFANNGLELTFRQACTADQKGEVEFLDVNLCITAVLLMILDLLPKTS